MGKKKKKVKRSFQLSCWRGRQHACWVLVLCENAFLDWLSGVYLYMCCAKSESFTPKHLVQPFVKQTVPNMSRSAAVNLLGCYDHGSVVLVPKKLIHWYVTSVGLLTVYPYKARAPSLSTGRSEIWSPVTGEVRQLEDLSSFPEQWKVAQPLVMSAFYLTLVGLNGWRGMGHGESH